MYPVRDTFLGREQLALLLFFNDLANNHFRADVRTGDLLPARVGSTAAAASHCIMWFNSNWLFGMLWGFCSKVVLVP